MSYFHLKSKPTMPLVNSNYAKLARREPGFKFPVSLFSTKKNPMIGMCWVSSFYIVRVRSSIFGFFLTHCTVGLMDTQVKKSLKGNAGENIYIGLVGMPKINKRVLSPFTR